MKVHIILVINISIVPRGSSCFPRDDDDVRLALGCFTLVGLEHGMVIVMKQDIIQVFVVLGSN